MHFIICKVQRPEDVLPFLLFLNTEITDWIQLQLIHVFPKEYRQSKWVAFILKISGLVIYFISIPIIRVIFNTIKIGLQYCIGNCTEFLYFKITEQKKTIKLPTHRAQQAGQLSSHYQDNADPAQLLHNN